ncbi:MAG: hypothetical protein ACYTEU_06915 [Planctomycetota bacterium]|jgi:hypothetical protein
MARSAHNDVLDSALDEIATSTKINICSAEPTTWAEAVSTYALASTVITAGDGGGNFTISDLPGTGRNLAIAQISNIDISSSGTANHIALTGTLTASTLQFVTICTPQALTAGGTVTIPLFNITSTDPTA